ncbi:hypothetical protein FPD75_20855 [Salmonella enterica subsp. enterica]|nr:hypothetical protein [Salmonella enterica subsp. enterica serovar Diguel]
MRLPTSYGSYGYFQASPGGKSREKHNFTFCSIILTTSALVKTINILRHSRRFFRCACKALLPAAP